MSLFLISYDLHLDRQYDRLWDRLNKLGAKKLLESVWLVSLNATAVQVQIAIKAVIDNDDSVAVIELDPKSDWATLRTYKGGNDWLKTYMP